jgi:hypothetical protein
MLYRVRIGRDEYLGSAEEVVLFLARTEGAPSRDPAAYMAAVAARLRERMGRTGVRTDDARAFLESLRESGIVPIETRPEPSDERVDPEEALGDGPVVYGDGVRPDDLDL